MQADGWAHDAVKHFSDPEAAARYADGPPRFVPGLHGMHRMAGILMAERAPADARVLVLGAGGGMEMKAFAGAQPGWSFVGVDPAGAMLEAAGRLLGQDAARAELVTGYIDDAPEGPFDAAACLLTLHFLDHGERLRTLREIRRRLRPGAPFVAAHGSIPVEGGRDLWFRRYAAFAAASGVDAEVAEGARKAVSSSINMIDPQEDEALMREAGFTGVTMFYAAFTFRGWVAYA